MTGVSDVSAEMTPKRLELLKLFAPDLRRVAILWDADNLGMTLRYRVAETGAQALGIDAWPQPEKNKVKPCKPPRRPKGLPEWRDHFQGS